MKTDEEKRAVLIEYMKEQMIFHDLAGYGWGVNDVFAMNAKVFKEFFDAVVPQTPRMGNAEPRAKL